MRRGTSEHSGGEVVLNILVVAADDYAYLVPFVEDEDCFFLKTIIPSRKATRDYLREGETDAED